MLFYDTRLSANNTTSCASCHVQAHAFGDPKPFSRGFHGAVTDRRAMPLVNLRYYQRARFFWDERAGNLEEMVLLPIQSRIEMGQDLTRVVDTFARDAMYPALFARAFGDRQITEQRIGKALAQFVRSIVSYQSRYDEGRARAQSAQDDFDNFTLQENRGKALFMRNCSTCHMKDGNEHFFVPTPANTGLRGTDPTADGGVGDVTLRPRTSARSSPPRSATSRSPPRTATTDASRRSTALDSREIRSLASAAASERVPVAFRPQSSEGLPGVIKDLKLPPAKHALALDIASPYATSSRRRLGQQ